MAIISRNHVLIRLPPSRRQMEFSEATGVSSATAASNKRRATLREFAKTAVGPQKVEQA
jgi:hypothetical protein